MLPLADPSALLLSAAMLDAPPASTPVEAPFRLELSLDAWLPRLTGNFTDGGTEVDAAVPDLHGAETAFAGSLALRGDRLGVEVRGFGFDTAGAGVATTPFTLGGLTVAAGDAFTSSFSWWSAGLEVSYDLWRPLAESPSPWSDPRPDWSAPANGTDFSLFVLGSADVSGLSRTIVDSTSGLFADADESFLAVGLGGGLRLAFDTPSGFPVVRRASITASGSYGAAVPMGGGDLGSTVRIEAELRAWFCPEGSAFLGYRLVGTNFDGEDMALAASLQGLFLGVGIEF